MFVVTGATGQFGRLAVEALLRRGVPAAQLAVAVRDTTRAADLAARGVTVRVADYDRPETLVPAFTGADKLLFVSANGPDDLRLVQHAAVVDAAARAGVGLVAYTSIVAADTNPLSLARVHRDTEARLGASGLPTVLLRNGWYTENYTAGLADSVRRGTLAGAAGRGAIASATRADLAEAAAVVLTSPDDQAGKIYELTGDTAWTPADLAAEASAVSGKRVTYTDLPAAQYAEILSGAGLPGFLVELLVDADTRIAEGALATIAPDLAELLGRPLTSLHDAVAGSLRDTAAAR
ncbi:NAD(P)H-binding protein [Nocardia fusca]|uniref:NAD(P)H-binding protein n=1 Tax=Nocardia fusca TaxID=941183 RepID=UPI0007A73415|nr:NAD(P)H-binding protein [Nocardia fusca]